MSGKRARAVIRPEEKALDRVEGLFSVWSRQDLAVDRVTGVRLGASPEPVYVMGSDGVTVDRVEAGVEARVPLFELTAPVGEKERIAEGLRGCMRALLRAVHEGRPKVEVARADVMTHFGEVYRGAPERGNATVCVYEHDGVAYGAWFPPGTRVRWERGDYLDEPEEVGGVLVLRVGLVVTAVEVKTATIVEAG